MLEHKLFEYTPIAVKYTQNLMMNILCINLNMYIYSDASGP